jgi:hypothetical protein
MIDKPKPILSEEAKKDLRKQLQGEYFYHFTLDTHFESIRERGLDPEFESEDSHTSAEPRAMRFCTQACLSTGLSAAERRATTWNGYQLLKTGEVALLRAKANSVLTRHFGPDRSHGEMRDDAQSMLRCNGSLSANDFIELMREHGVISVYEIIPASELEFCTSDIRRFCKDFVGEFTPLA